jgi:hypothetical protein
MSWEPGEGPDSSKTIWRSHHYFLSKKTREAPLSFSQRTREAPLSFSKKICEAPLLLSFRRGCHPTSEDDRRGLGEGGPPNADRMRWRRWLRQRRRRMRRRGGHQRMTVDARRRCPAIVGTDEMRRWRAVPDAVCSCLSATTGGKRGKIIFRNYVTFCTNCDYLSKRHPHCQPRKQSNSLKRRSGNMSHCSTKSVACMLIQVLTTRICFRILLCNYGRHIQTLKEKRNSAPGFTGLQSTPPFREDERKRIFLFPTSLRTFLRI